MLTKTALFSEEEKNWYSGASLSLWIVCSQVDSMGSNKKKLGKNGQADYTKCATQLLNMGLTPPPPFEQC